MFMYMYLYVCGCVCIIDLYILCVYIKACRFEGMDYIIYYNYLHTDTEILSILFILNYIFAHSNLCKEDFF